MRAKTEWTCVRRKGSAYRDEASRRRLLGLAQARSRIVFALLALGGGLSAGVGLGGGAAEAADIDPGTFVFDTSAPGIMVVPKATLENDVCGLSSVRARTVGGLTSISAPAEIVDINANMNIQGLLSNNNAPGSVAAASIQVSLPIGVDFNNGQPETTGVVISRFCMETTTPVSLSCGTFDVALTLDPAAVQTPGSFVLTPDQFQGGSFTSDLDLHLSLHFSDTQKGTTVIVPHTVTYASSGQWAFAPGPTGATAAQQMWVDSDCDGTDDVLVAGTPDFFPGWTPSGLQTEVTFTDQAKGGYLRLEPPTKSGR